MRRTEFLQELQEALEGEVSSGVIQENMSYYGNYISQEAAKGRSENEIIEELGGPRIIAKTIVDSSEAGGDSVGSSGTHYGEHEAGNESGRGAMRNTRYVDLSKWYWKFLLIAVVILVLVVVFTVVGGIFSLFFRFAGPFILIWLVISFFKGMRR